MDGDTSEVLQELKKKMFLLKWVTQEANSKPFTLFSKAWFEEQKPNVSNNVWHLMLTIVIFTVLNVPYVSKM